MKVRAFLTFAAIAFFVKMHGGGCQRLQLFESHLPFRYALHGSFLTAGVELDRADFDLPLDGLLPLLLP